MSTPLAVVLESTVEQNCPQVEIDELRQNSEEIVGALKALGYHTEILPFSLDIAAVRRTLEKMKPSVVFNLVDSIEGKGNLIAMAPMLLAHMGIPFTGANAMATAITCDKLVTKQILKAQNIRTADWLTEAQLQAGGAEIGAPYILKSITEHASFGMFADSVVDSRALLTSRWQEKKNKFGGDWFAEEYIDGREFNLSVLASSGSEPCIALPCAEICFTSDFPQGKPRIVDYAAKWHEDTAEYKGTVRNFDFPQSDTDLLNSLQNIARTCWQAFSLSGYARVDFRIAANGTPYVLEVNSNPFLTANEGFGSAAARAGIPFASAIRAIVEDAYKRTSAPLPAMLAA